VWTPTHRIASSPTTKRAYACATVEAVDQHLRNLRERRKATESFAELILLTDDMDMLLDTRNLVARAPVRTWNGSTV